MTVSAKFVIGADSTAPWEWFEITPVPRFKANCFHEGPDAVAARGRDAPARAKKAGSLRSARRRRRQR